MLVTFRWCLVVALTSALVACGRDDASKIRRDPAEPPLDSDLHDGGPAPSPRPITTSWQDPALAQSLERCIDVKSIEDTLVRVRVATSGTATLVDACFSDGHDATCITNEIVGRQYDTRLAGERTIAIRRRFALPNGTFSAGSVTIPPWRLHETKLVSGECRLRFAPP